MYITPTNNTNFSGKIIPKKSIKNQPEFIKKLINLDAFKSILENNDLVIRLEKRLAYDAFHLQGEPLYRVKISVLRENSLVDRLLDALGFIKRHKLTEEFHSRKSTLERIDNWHVRKNIYQRTNQ